MSRNWISWTLLFLIWLFVYGPGISQENGSVDIPPVPEGKQYISDRVGLLSESTKQKIGSVQETAAMDHQTQIVVVTISSKHKYGGSGLSIEEFAMKWFNEWGIGIRRDGTLYNRGILFLVSFGDRKARIELGKEWGQKWNQYARRVMDENIISNFKQDKFERGILEGVRALAKMAERGPDATPPERSTIDRWVHEASRVQLDTAYLQGWPLILFAVLGILMIVSSCFVENETLQNVLFWGGVVILVLDLITYVALFLLAIYGKGSSGGGGGFAGGGGFGGGTSGGGGATGSW